MSDYFISDTHFNHSNVIKYCNRPFGSVEEMNKVLISKWNNTVRKTDRVFCLGDFCFGNKELISYFARQLQGKKILIMGNHERSNIQLYLDAGFAQVINFPILYTASNGSQFILSHKPLENMGNEYKYIYGHVHNLSVQRANAFCVSVEHTNYRPVTVEEILSGKNYTQFLENEDFIDIK